MRLSLLCKVILLQTSSLQGAAKCFDRTARMVSKVLKNWIANTFDLPMWLFALVYLCASDSTSFQGLSLCARLTLLCLDISEYAALLWTCYFGYMYLLTSTYLHPFELMVIRMILWCMCKHLPLWFLQSVCLHTLTISWPPYIMYSGDLSAHCTLRPISHCFVFYWFLPPLTDRYSDLRRERLSAAVFGERRGEGKCNGV